MIGIQMYDVIFISYNEPTADKAWNKLLERCPMARRVHGVKGIHNAHVLGAKRSFTKMVWFVDADADVMEDFDFSYTVDKWDLETVHVWRSQNPVNGLIYGYGGIKLFPRHLTIQQDTSRPDMTTSLSKSFKAMKQISCTTAFNVDPFNTFKSAFRECCKLASKVIDRQKDKETEHRLDTWCTVGEDKPFGKYALQGAKLGRQYGYDNKDDVTALYKINDYEWLQEKFNGSN